MHLLLDNFDSFTYNLYEYFRQLGLEYTVLRSDSEAWQKIDYANVKSLVISPGPEKPENAPLCNHLIKKLGGKIPILGICLGHQAIGQFFGAELYEMNYPMHGKARKLQIVKQQPLFNNLPGRFLVMQYHSLALKIEANSELEVLAKMEDETVMAIKHRNKNIFGLQFHPESILTENGLQVLKNWLEYSDIY